MMTSRLSIISFSICVLIYIVLMYSMKTMLVFIEVKNLNANLLRDVTEVLDVDVQPAAMFKSYMRDFNKSYGKEEMMWRFDIFKNSLKEIARLNKETGALHGLTKFSDRSEQELFLSSGALNVDTFNFEGSLESGCAYKPSKKLIRCLQDEEVTGQFDWRSKDVVRPVLDQLQCNGCWAFSIVGVMESMAAIKLGMKGESLSIEELIDCTVDTAKCSGGSVKTALRWLCDSRWAVVTEDEYPLVLINRTCNYKPNEGRYLEGRRVKWYYRNRYVNNEKDILRLIKCHGPVIAVVNAYPWHNYLDGVIQRSCYRSQDGYTMDHVVQIVGYDLDAPVPYYLIRNSWGDDFGIKGYVKLAFGINICGVAEQITILDVY